MAGSTRGSGAVGRRIDLRSGDREERILFFLICAFFSRVYCLLPEPVTPVIRYLVIVGYRDA